MHITYAALITGMYTCQKKFIKLYCKGERKERYFRESDIPNKTFYYNALGHRRF